MHENLYHSLTCSEGILHKESSRKSESVSAWAIAADVTLLPVKRVKRETLSLLWNILVQSKISDFIVWSCGTS